MQRKQNLTGYPSIDKPWLSNYPGDLIPPRKKFDRILDKLKDVWTNPEETIIDYYDTEIKTGDFFSRIDAVAKALTALGIECGDSIVASLESVPEYIELLLACEIIGSSIKNYLGDAEQIISLINADDTVKLYIAPDYLSAADAASIYATTSIKSIIVIDPLFSVQDKRNLRSNIAEVINSKYSAEITDDTRNIAWEDFLENGRRIDSIKVNDKNSRRLFSAFTSGSIGNPKEVIHSSESVLGIIRQLVIFPYPNKGKDTWLLTILPPTLVAVVVAMMLYPLADGKRLLLDPFCEVQDLDLEMMYYCPNGWGLVPIFFEMLIDSTRIPDDYDMGFFKHLGFGAEPMSKKTAYRVQSFLDSHKCKFPFSSGYGQSEGGSDFTVGIGKEMILSGSAGIPLIDTIVSIFKPSTIEELQYNEIGEICKSGPGIMLGYSDKALTDEVLKIHPDGNLWLHTGDFGYMTEQGLLFVLGRERIQVSSDKFVFPLEIEDKIASVDGVKDAVIVSGKDKNGTEFRVPYLFIVPEKGMSESELLARVNAFIATELSPEQKPKSIFVIKKKPISKFKVDRKALQQKYDLI